MMLDAAVESAGVGPWLDQILSVEDVGVFKISPKTYQLAVDRLKSFPARRKASCFRYRRYPV